jgi:hypothetical protein
LGKLNWKWIYFQNKSVDDLLLHYLLQDLNVSGPDGIAAFLNGFHEMEFLWHENEEIREAVYNGIITYYGNNNVNNNNSSGSDQRGEWGRSLVRIIASLDDMSTNWDHLPDAIQESILQGIEKSLWSFTAQEITTSLFQ